MLKQQLGKDYGSEEYNLIPATVNFHSFGQFNARGYSTHSVNTENKCAVRSLYLDNKESGAFVFPQRGKNEWSNWGFSNNVKLHLTKGKHLVTLNFRDFDDNMNLEITQAMIDYLQLVRLGDQVVTKE